LDFARKVLLFGTVNGALCILLGAFAAHGLKNRLSAQLLSVYQTGVEYHFYHALALILLGVLVGQYGCNPFMRWSARFFIIGVLLFSGSLYSLSLTGITVLGAITPIGGICFVLGWIVLALAVVQPSDSNR